MRPERPRRDREPHCERRGVPPRCGKAVEDRVFGSFFVEVKRLWIEFGRKTQDVLLGDGDGPFALEAHSEFQIIEPFDHADSASDLFSSCPGFLPGIHVLPLDHEKTWMAGHRRAEATPFFERLCPATTN